MEDRALPFIHPDDPMPVSLDAIRERKRAIRAGEVLAPSRDELPAFLKRHEIVDGRAVPKDTAEIDLEPDLEPDLDEEDLDEEDLDEETDDAEDPLG